MIKDYIKYEEKEYQVSTVNIDGMLETMIFPVENGVVSGSEVYKFRTFDAGESQRKHRDILTNIGGIVMNDKCYARGCDHNNIDCTCMYGVCFNGQRDRFPGHLWGRCEDSCFHG